MDVTIPIKDGIQASEEIKENHPNSCIIMLTALGDEEIMDIAKNAGVNIFIQKPFNDYKIISAISSL